jgi:membrane-bound inhibitor of C-type lysozyme
MELIFNDELPIINGEKVVVRWDGKDNSGNKVGSGIYIFFTESDDEIVKGKLAIIN